MFKAPLLFVSARLAIATLYTPAQAQGPAPVPQLSVSGMATVSVRPDRATIIVGYVNGSIDAAKAATKNALVSQQIKNAAINAGILKADIQTANYSLQPQYTDGIGYRLTINGYSASNTMNLIVRKISSLASVIAAVQAAGANDICNLQFTYAHQSTLQDQAHVAALADAYHKATLDATACGDKIDGTLQVSDFQQSQPYYGGFAGGMGGSMGGMINGAVNPAISGGKIEISYSVSVTYRIAPLTYKATRLGTLHRR
jgi:uncharacterized protein YggE